MNRLVLALKYTSPHNHAAISDARRPLSCALAYMAANDSSVKQTSYNDEAKQTLPRESLQNLIRLETSIESSELILIYFLKMI